MKRSLLLLAAAIVATGAIVMAQARQGGAPNIAIDPDDIAGVVTGSSGPEAGVWVIAGFASLVVGYFLLGATLSVPLLLATAVITGFGNGVLRPALTSLISHQAGRHEQGTVLGVSQALMSMASVVIPVLSGVLIEYDYLAVWCWTAGAFAAVGWALSIGGVRESPGLKTSPA